MKLIFQPREFERLEGVHSARGEPEALLDKTQIPAQGYELRINTDSIQLRASDSAGLFYGRQTLNEIYGQYSGAPVPCCRIVDWPDLANRGYMLDVSRDRVPTMEHLFHLVDTLAALRYNQLQLYTEHTFAYSRHKQVWSNASPLTAAEIRKLDSYCRERYIELVANQNSFGHMERWLEHDAYRHLAECPEGFRHPISGEWRPQGSVIKPDAGSLEFLDGLYSELLPNFSSRKFNIGGDEPWELGEGASAARVRDEGKHKVYADFLAQVCGLATQHGAEPMCWADVLFEEPSSIGNLPDAIRPIIWGYEVEHPFETQCAILAELSREFYVAPGDSTWTSFTGRLPTMLANVRSAAAAGKMFGAAGLLMTHWGDGGHPQSWPICLPGIVWAGLCSWNVDVEEPALKAGLQSLLCDENGAYVDALLECGTMDASLDVPLVNRSYLAHVNQLNGAKRRGFQPKPSRPSLLNLIGSCQAWIDALGKAKLGSEDASCLIDELKIALSMNKYVASRCVGAEDVEQIDELRELYKKCWHYRSRSGGLGDSLAKHF